MFFYFRCSTFSHLSNSASSLIPCVHCDELALPPIYHQDDKNHDKPFCCEGCLTVYQVLHQKGLESYYEIKNQAAVFKRCSPVELKANEFEYLDDAEFFRECAHVDAFGALTMEFYLEGIH